MIALRSFARKRRHRSLVAAFLVVVGLLVVWEHAGEPEPHAHAEELGEFCLAVFSGLSAVGVLGASALLRRRRLPQPTSTRAPFVPCFVRPEPLPASRAGPASLQVLRR